MSKTRFHTNVGLSVFTTCPAGTRKVLRCTLFITLIAAVAFLSACGKETRVSQVHYVHLEAPAGGDGQTWDTAFDHPQDALNVAQGGDQVWVAGGIYGPADQDSGEVLRLAKEVTVLGGFAGGESQAWQRDPARAVTVLDGQGVSFHVVTGADGAVMDGFTITGGNANGNIVEGRYGGTFTGGGLFNAGVSPEIRNCVFAGNSATLGGGAVYNEDNSPRFEDCVFEYNQADFGGAIENRNSGVTVVNSHFRNNVSRLSGGGVANFQGAPVFINGVFSGNVSTHVGGAVLGNCSDAVFANCSFTGNRSQAGGGIGMWKGSVRVMNSILWDNSSADGTEITDVDGAVDVKFSIVKGGYSGTGNQDADPCFVDKGRWAADGAWVEGDYRLTSSSPAVDSGTGSGAPDYDAEYNLRPQALAHDLGAYERLEP